MQIRVLGCSGAICAGRRTTSFLLDDDVLIDAGSGVGDLALDELARIDHVLLSHSHHDHVLGVPLLADSVLCLRAGRPPIRVHALPHTLAALRDHVFNGVIWPDFTRLPSSAAPILEFNEVAHSERLDLGRGRMVEVLPAVHTVPAAGFAVHAEGGAWVFTGDTAPNPALWQRLRELRVAHLVIETAFPDRERRLAQVSQHLHPSALGAELAQLGQPTQVHVTHVKPSDLELVMSEVGSLASDHCIGALREGQVIGLG
jgi:ribonuclease BN (tRNA processing enzyme)